MVSKRSKSRKKKRKNSNILRIGGALGRLVRFAREKSARFLARLTGFVKSCWHTYTGLPRLLRFAGIYLLVVLVAGSIFYWRLAQLRIAEPYALEPQFDWEPFSADEEPGTNVGASEPEESTVAGEPEAEPESEPAVAEPVFVPGVWPVSGDLFYGFHETVIQSGSGYPLYYTSKGIAIKAVSGTEIVAAWGGTVIAVSEKDKPHGHSVIVEHDNGFIAYYGALDKATVAIGDRVEQGMVIGSVSTGYQSEPDYLYLEMEKDGRVVDPVEYLAS